MLLQLKATPTLYKFINAHLLPEGEKLWIHIFFKTGLRTSVMLIGVWTCTVLVLKMATFTLKGKIDLGKYLFNRPAQYSKLIFSISISVSL